MSYVSGFLCHFHVLKIFKNKISSLPLPEEENRGEKTVQALEYAQSLEIYEEHYTKLYLAI